TAERVHETLQALSELAPDRTVAIARELTKRFESVSSGVAKQLKLEPLVGEIVLLIEGKPAEPQAIFSKEFLQSCVADVAKTSHMKEGISQVARQLKLPKRLVYNAVHKQLGT